MKKFDRCVLHIGTEKTGSTAIQLSLALNRSRLLAEGILYPKSLGRKTHSQWEIVGAVDPDCWKKDIGRSLGITGSSTQTQFRSQLESELEREFSQANRAHTLMISCEHLQSRINNRNTVLKLKEFLQRWVRNFEIIVYFRRQDRLAISHQSTIVKSLGSVEKIDLALSSKNRLSYFRYDELFERWAFAFQAENVMPHLYRPDLWSGSDIFSHFCRVAGLPTNLRSANVQNQSLNTAGFHFLNTLNELFPIDVNHVDHEMRQALAHAISEEFTGNHLAITRAEALAFYEQFRQSNLRLKQIAFPDHIGELFSTDFSEYPVSRTEIEPKYEHAIAVAYHLWQTTWKPSSSSSFWRKIRSFAQALKP